MDRAQTGGPITPFFIMAMGAVAVALYLFAVDMSHGAPETVRTVEWCVAHNGTLLDSNLFTHGSGAHCRLPNGTSVHVGGFAD